MKNKKILAIGLCGVICLSIVGVTYASALASDTPKVSTSETGNTSSADILYQDTDGGQISVDGKNWVAEADYEKNNAAPDVQWWTVYSIRITVNSIRNDGTTRKDPGNGGKPRKIKGFSELMKRGGTRIDMFFEKRAHFSEQKEKLSTLSTKRAGKPHKQRVPGSFLNWNE